MTSLPNEIFKVCLHEYFHTGDSQRAAEGIAHALADSRARTINECIDYFQSLADETMYVENCRRWNMAIQELREFKKRESK